MESKAKAKLKPSKAKQSNTKQSKRKQSNAKQCRAMKTMRCNAKLRGYAGPGATRLRRGCRAKQCKAKQSNVPGGSGATRGPAQLRRNIAPAPFPKEVGTP